MPVRKAKATWEGGLKGGRGRFQGQTGLSASYNFTSRFEEGPGSSPEELLAAAHAACFSMALAGALEKAGQPATRIETEGACTIEKQSAGFVITSMKLVTRAAVPGLDEATFQKVALATKAACPVSQALQAIRIDLDAQLA